MTNETDRELLELAAKAAGLSAEFKEWVSSSVGAFRAVKYTKKQGFFIGAEKWNPLADDGDALRLAVKLGMLIDQYNGVANAYASHGADMFESHHEDPYAATRRAIVRAAAEIGKAMK